MTEKTWGMIAGACFANFTAFFLIAIFLGGDALNGKAEGARYFLGSRGHLTEVSHALYVYSRCHTISVFITHPLLLLAATRADAARRRRNPPTPARTF